MQSNATTQTPPTSLSQLHINTATPYARAMFLQSLLATVSIALAHVAEGDFDQSRILHIQQVVEYAYFEAEQLGEETEAS